MATVAYNPNDPKQAAFLSALALGESGNKGSSASFLGVGGVDLSGSATDQYGFPVWNGTGNSHAAGLFQFQPGTWDPLAKTYGLNFANPSDQTQGAWILAQDTYAAKTGGQSLEDALNAGNYSQVQSALSSIWPSVNGNMAAPQGLAHDIANGIGATITGVGQSNSASGTSSNNQPAGIIGTVEGFFVRGGLILVGGIIVLIALWQLLSSQGIVPSPADTAKAVGNTASKAATIAVAAA